MKTHPRYLLPAAVLAFCCELAPCSAGPGVNPVGVWQLVSYTATDPSTGTTTQPFGADARGLAIYSAGGHMSLLVAARDRGPAATGTLSSSGLRARWLDSMFAYTGTFTVQGDQLTIHIETAWHPDWVDTVKTRTLTLSHDILTVSTPPMTSPVDGKTYISVTRFKRVE
jgi:hypothetical protein